MNNPNTQKYFTDYNFYNDLFTDDTRKKNPKLLINILEIETIFYTKFKNNPQIVNGWSLWKFIADQIEMLFKSNLNIHDLKSLQELKNRYYVCERIKEDSYLGQN